MPMFICQSCKKRSATMLSKVLVDGEQRTLRLCGLCAHRFSMKQSWLQNPYGGAPAGGEGGVVTGDLGQPVPPGTESLVFTSITRRGQWVMEWAERQSTNYGMGSLASAAVLVGLLTEEKAASFEIMSEMGVDMDTRSLLRRAQDIAASFQDPLVEPEPGHP